MNGSALPRISFRPLARSDFALLARWLSDPEVHRWWFQGHTPDALERDFGPQIDGTEPGDDRIVLLEPEVGDEGSGAPDPVGLVQMSRIVDFPEDVAELAPVMGEIPATAWCVDYLLGEAWARRRGLGPHMVSAAVADVFGRFPQAQSVIVPVVAANRASWRVLEKAGFAIVATGPMTPENPADDRTHHVLRLDRQ